MKILITGAMGNVGPAVVARLARHGHQAKVIDRKLDAGKMVAGVEYVEGDVTDFGALREQVKGQQAIIHLAAYAYPAAAPGQEIFRLNCSGTYNVFEAAAQEGIRRVICASSINALGFNFGVKSFEIRYFPIDEEHPGFTTDPYSFSKQMLEEIAAYYWRRDAISSACLRLPFVVPPPRDDMPFNIQEFVGRVRAGYHRLFDLPAAERDQRVRKMVAHFDQLRAERAFEKPWDQGRMALPPEEGDTMEEMHLGYSDFWTVISAEDSAQAFEKAVLANYQGSHALYVNSGQNWIGVPSEILAQAFYADVNSRKRPVNGLESLVNIQKARQLIGYEPENPMGLS